MWSLIVRPKQVTYKYEKKVLGEYLNLTREK
jgi:hypothetical protein